VTTVALFLNKRKNCLELRDNGEDPWSSGERRGLTWTWVRIPAYLKTRPKDGPLDGRKSNQKIKAFKWGLPHPDKDIFK